MGTAEGTPAHRDAPPSPPPIHRFLAVLLRVGATGFGGPMALISMLQEHLVERRRMVSADDFSEGVAIGQVLPGPIAVDAAVHVGYRLYGWIGGMTGALGLILPPFLIMLVLTPLYYRHGRIPEAQGFFMGMRPAVAAAIAAATVRLGRRGIKDGRAGVIAVVAFSWMLIRECLGSYVAELPTGSFASRVFGWSGAVFAVVVSGLLGLLLHRPSTSADAGTRPGRRTSDGGSQ